MGLKGEWAVLWGMGAIAGCWGLAKGWRWCCGIGVGLTWLACSKSGHRVSRAFSAASRMAKCGRRIPLIGGSGLPLVHLRTALCRLSCDVIKAHRYQHGVPCAFLRVVNGRSRGAGTQRHLRATATGERQRSHGCDAVLTYSRLVEKRSAAYRYVLSVGRT